MSKAAACFGADSLTVAGGKICWLSGACDDIVLGRIPLKRQPASRDRPVGRFAMRALSVLWRFVISSMASGCSAATCKSIRDGPSGLRLPCSQLRRVATLIPIRAANLSWDRPYRSRIFLTSDSGNSVLREGFILPFIIAAPCLTLSSNSSNSSFFIAIPEFVS